MKKIILALILLTGLSNAITVKECKQLEKDINNDAKIDYQMENMKKFVDNDCDSRMGEPTREKRVKEIKDAADTYNKKM